MVDPIVLVEAENTCNDLLSFDLRYVPLLIVKIVLVHGQNLNVVFISRDPQIAPDLELPTLYFESFKIKQPMRLPCPSVRVDSDIRHGSAYIRLI